MFGAMMTGTALGFPAAPSGLSAVVLNGNQISLNWTDNSSGESGFRIERCSGAACSGFTEVTTVGAGVTTHTDSGLSTGTSYSYRVRAYTIGVGVSPYSNTATDVTGPNLTSVSASGAGGNTCLAEGNWIVTAAWFTDGPDNTNFKTTVDRSIEASPSTWINVVADGTTDDSSYADDTALQGNTGGVTAPTTHYRTYRIRIIRRSDSAIMDELITNTVSITFYVDVCA